MYESGFMAFLLNSDSDELNSCIFGFEAVGLGFEIPGFAHHCQGDISEAPLFN